MRCSKCGAEGVFDPCLICSAVEHGVISHRPKCPVCTKAMKRLSFRQGQRFATSPFFICADHPDFVKKVDE